MVSKIIHYCWFGGGDKSKKMKRYIENWKKKLPDYEIIEWNESNFNIYSNKYVKEAYELRKFAFVSDYVRLYALYNYGGVYFDTDVEVIKNIDQLLEKNKDIYGFELKEKIMTGVMIAKKNSNIIKEFLSKYEDRSFIDSNGDIDLTPNTKILTELLKRRGLILNNQIQEFSDFIALPIEYLAAFDLQNLCENITQNSFTIHHYDFSWALPKDKYLSNLKKFFSKILGKKLYNKIRCITKIRKWS